MLFITEDYLKRIWAFDGTIDILKNAATKRYVVVQDRLKCNPIPPNPVRAPEKELIGVAGHEHATRFKVMFVLESADGFPIEVSPEWIIYKLSTETRQGGDRAAHRKIEESYKRDEQRQHNAVKEFAREEGKYAGAVMGGRNYHYDGKSSHRGRQ